MYECVKGYDIVRANSAVLYSNITISVRVHAFSMVQPQSQITVPLETAVFAIFIVRMGYGKFVYKTCGTLL